MIDPFDVAVDRIVGKHPLDKARRVDICSYTYQNPNAKTLVAVCSCSFRLEPIFFV